MKKQSEKKKLKNREFFTPEEDSKLIRLKKEFPDKSWQEIGELMGKSGRQCNDRYNKHLKQPKSGKPWSSDEEQQLQRLVEIHGHKWGEISKIMGSRSPFESKNRWYFMNRKKLRSSNQVVPYNDCYNIRFNPFMFYPPQIQNSYSSSNLTNTHTPCEGVSPEVRELPTEPNHDIFVFDVFENEISEDEISNAQCLFESTTTIQC